LFQRSAVRIAVRQQCVIMRHNSAGRITAAKIRTADSSRREEALLLVCGGLFLALVALAGRIVTAL
jgi:hypothetical protein